MRLLKREPCVENIVYFTSPTIVLYKGYLTMSVPRWLKNLESPQMKGRKAEKKYAKKWGARTQPASGALPFNKEDLENDEYLIQLKTTGAKQFILKLKDLVILRTHAIKVGKKPLLVLEMGGRLWAVMPLGDTGKQIRS